MCTLVVMSFEIWNLEACGVRQGDCVVGYLPNSSLAVEAMLASVSIGAAWSSTSPDFGVLVSWLSLIPVIILCIIT